MGTNNPTQPPQDKYKKDYHKTDNQFDWGSFQKQAPSVDFLTPELFVLMLKNI